MNKTVFTLLTTWSLMAGAIATPAWAQRVVDVGPSPQASTVAPDTSISGVFDATNTPAIDPASIKIIVNNQDVTRQSTITAGFFSYRPAQPFTPGPVEVRIEFANVNGLRQAANWSFTVQRPQPLAAISAITHNASEATLSTEATFLATINGTPGSQARVLLIQDNRTVRELTAQEVSAGVYVASMALQPSDRLNQGIVVGQLTRQGETVFAAASSPVVIAPTSGSSAGITTTQISGGASSTPSSTPGTTDTTAIAIAPEFTSHRDGDRVGGSGFTLVGKTRPNATVDVVVTSGGVSIIGLLNVGNETLVNRQVTADANGEFRVDVPAPSIRDSGTRFTVRATAQADGDRGLTEITLTQR